MPEPPVAVSTPAIKGQVEDYLAACRAKGLSPKTVKLAYGYPLRGVFLPWCAEEGLTEPGQLTSRLLERFSARLMERGGKRGPLSRDTVFAESMAVAQIFAQSVLT